jgi:D-tyrosyl-tRNA(Tyr) deacylase
MKIVIQRVKYVNLYIDEKIYGKISRGLLVFLGISNNDTKSDAEYLVKKLINMRIFNDNNNKMNLSIKDLQLSIMLVSQFTLYADCQSGNRPSFRESASQLTAKSLYNFFIEEIDRYNINFRTGKFGAMMDIEYINDGPVTIILES